MTMRRLLIALCVIAACSSSHDVEPGKLGGFRDDFRGGPSPTLANDYKVGGAGPQVVALDSTRKGVVVRDNATPITGTLFGVQDSAGTAKFLDVQTAYLEAKGPIRSTNQASGGFRIGPANAGGDQFGIAQDALTSPSYGIFVGNSGPDFTSRRLDLASQADVTLNMDRIRAHAYAGNVQAGSLFSVGDGGTFTSRWSLDAVAANNIEQRLKSHAAFTGSDTREATGAVRTTDATVSTCWSKTLSDNTLYWLKVEVIGRDEGGTNRAWYERAIRVHRQGGGAASASSVQPLITDETNAAWDATIDVNTNDVRVRVTGAAAVNVSWTCTVTWQGVSLST